MTKQSIVLAAAVAASLTSIQAVADVTANVGVATTYLWRGTNLSQSAPQVSGGVDYSHESGFYAGIWHGSEGGYAGPETDIYLGFGGEIEGISYDIGFITYQYFMQDSLGFGTGNEFDEIYFGVGYGPVGFTYAVDSDNETTYLTLSGEYEAFSITYGAYTFDLTPTADYSHIDLSYALTDELSVTYSIPSTDAVGDAEDPILVFSYGLEFEVN